MHAREDHVSEALTREATVAGPSLEGLVLDDVDLTDLDVWEERVPYEWLAPCAGRRRSTGTPSATDAGSGS